MPTTILTSYFAFNLVLAVSYLLARFILTGLRSEQSQQQQLKLVRFAFLASLSAFVLIPILLRWLPLNTELGFELHPLLHHGASSLRLNQTMQGIAGRTKYPSHTAVNLIAIACYLLFAVIAVFTIWRARSIVIIKRLLAQSHLHRKQQHLSILLNKKIAVPFCWSFGLHSYIVLPTTLIQQPHSFRLAIRHELQHLRQRDTRWLYLLAIISVINFWNPFARLWTHWFSELQEFACDEALILRDAIVPQAYGQCLLDVAKNTLVAPEFPHGALGISSFASWSSNTILKRRVTMLFHYKQRKPKKLLSVIAGAFLTVSAISTAYALNGQSVGNISMPQLQKIVAKSNANNNPIQVEATPELLKELNNIRSSTQAREYMQASLQRMKKYQPMIEKQFAQQNMPKALMALALAESGYQNLPPSKNPFFAAGIWQFIPATAQKYGMKTDPQQDDRMNPEIETKAAIAYLQKLHDQFSDWNVALIAYEIGEDATEQLIKATGKNNAWQLARSSYAPEGLKKYLPFLQASMLISQNPELVSVN